MALTDAQVTDVRRHLGYGVVGTTQPINADNDVVYLVFGTRQMSLFQRLTTLTASEEAVVVSYLTTLATLEAAVPAAGANLDTDRAAVWARNRSEVADRMKLLDAWRLRLCAFLGCAPGPGITIGAARLSRC